MQYPAFFDRVPPIRLRDPLAELLGAFEGGVMEIGYLDTVRLAGHSCPTVAGAFLMARKGLAALYGDQLPQRGEIQVEMQEPVTQGVCGVIANVLTLITGATDESGFHGLAGRFDRRHLLSFGNDNPAPVTLLRKDTGLRVSLNYDPSFVPADPRMGLLMQRVLAGSATADEAGRFGRLWQGRVEAILCEHADDPRLVKVSEG
ncbi:MAG: hypothetical protein OQL28_05930 [Sedimenticola sp.]|nr:hypothetical protein [Sedimenticola sp.]